MSSRPASLRVEWSRGHTMNSRRRGSTPTFPEPMYQRSPRKPLIILEGRGGSFFGLGSGLGIPGFMHILFNAIAASSGSGLTYVRNVAAVLARRGDVRATFLVGPELAGERSAGANVAFEEMREPQSVARRVVWEQSVLPRIVRRLGADVLVSAGNFALRRSSVPQILLSGNSLYTSADYRRDLLQRREYGLWLDNGVRSFWA